MNKPSTNGWRQIAKNLMALAVAGTLLSSLIGSAAEPPVAEAKPKGWESSAAAGFSLTTGNSESFLMTISANTARKWSKDELLRGEGDEILFGASFGYGKDSTGGNSRRTQDYVNGYGQWNQLFTSKLYGGLRVDGLYDSIAGIDYRFTISPILGYYFIKQEKIMLSGEVGPSYINERLAGDSHSYFGLRIAERFEWKISATTKFWQYAEYLPQVDDFDNYVINAEAGLDTAITKQFSVRLVAQNTYRNQPAAGRERNDFKLLAGLAYKF